MKKKILVCMLALTMCVGVTPVTTYAEENSSVVTEQDTETTDEGSELTEDQTDEGTTLGMTEKTTDVTTEEETVVTEDTAEAGETPTANSSMLTVMTADTSVNHANLASETEPKGETVASVTIAGASEEYTTLEEAIAAANNAEGEERVTVKILKSGEYKGFQLTRDNITIEAADGIDAVFVKPETSYDGPYGGAVSIDSLDAKLKNLTFKSEQYDGWSFVYVKDDASFESCKFVGDDTAGTALMYNQKGSTKGAPIVLTVDNCTFDNFSEGIRTCGDSTKLGKFTLTNNTFTNVLYSINIYFGCGNDSTEPNLIISGNTFDSGKYETSYVHFWDYVQTQQFYGTTDAYDRTGTALNVKMEGNTYNGDVRVTATHCDWYTDTPIDVDESTKERMVYRHLVELEGAESATLTYADGTALPEGGGDLHEWNESQTKYGKTYIYALSEGEYIINIKVDENADVITKPLTVKSQTPGETTNKITISDEEKYVASIGEEKYTGLQAAIDAAKENDIITILRDGTYKPFAIDRKQHNGLVVKAADGVKVTFEVNKEQQFTLKDGYAKETAGISFENIDFVSTDGTTILYSNYFGKDGHSFNVSNCTFTNKSEITEENTPIAIYVDFPNLTIENCTFNNWTTAYYTAGEGYVIGDMNISNNTLNDVHCLVNGYWANPASADSKLVIENNTVNNSDSEEAVIVLWDYTQYLHWLKDPYFGPDHGTTSAFVAPDGSGVVTVKGNSNTVVSAVHCNWYADSVLDNVDAEVTYSNLIEVDDGIESVEVYDAETNELVAEMKTNEATGKKYIYTLAEGEYTVHVKAKDSDLISMPLVVEEPKVGETTNKISLTEDNKYVASIGDKKYTSIQDAIKNIKSGDTLELLNDIVVDKGLYFVSSDTNKLSDITIKGNGHTVKASDAFQTNEYGQNNLMKFDGVEGVTLEDITLVSSSASKHTLDTHKSTVTLKDVTLDHTNAGSGAPLIDNASDITVEGVLNLLTGENSWYGINVDNKNGAASLTFAEGASLTHTMSKEVVTILKEETEGQPPVVIEGTENVGLLEKEDGSYVVHTHTLTVVEEVPATCTEDGMKKYYECSECKKYFADEAGDVEITDLESLVIPANGHQYDDRGKCTVCGVLTPDAEAANKVDALIDAIGSPDKVTLDSKAAIEAAVNAYNKLTDAQKKLVTGYEDLDKAVKVYNALLEAEEGKDPEKDPDKDKPIDKPDKGSDSEDKKPGAVQTGDTTNVAGYMAVMVLAAGIAVFAVIRRKRRG